MSNVSEAALEGDLQGILLVPSEPAGLGVIVLGGSSGRIDVDRARLFAQRGAHAIAQRWFGGTRQTPGICEIPVEVFARAVDRLQRLGCSEIAIVGVSKGAEGALLASVHDPRIDVVIAFSPSSVVWANSGVGADGAGWPLRSSWTFGGAPLPFVPYDVSQLPAQSDGPVPYRAYHETSLRVFADRVPEAAIPIERTRAKVLLVAGRDDALWPSDWFAERLAERRRAAGLSVTVVIEDDAGHRTLLPGETTPRSVINLHGGTDEADARLGTRAWEAILAMLPRLRRHCGE